MFHWEDGIDMSALGGWTTKMAQYFTNWASENPKHQVNNCVQMHTEQELRGKWSDEPCAKKNLVICERKQKWSLEKMQDMVEAMMFNFIPIGFIYIQLPNQASPEDIWSWVIWQNISEQYDSTFFRVVKKKSEVFGKIQEEFSPYIDEISRPCVGNCVYADKVKLSRNGGWSGDIYTVLDYQGNGGNNETLNFYTVGGEVRPRNMAVKVWQRIG